ncbi:thiamine pyrophosphokinase [Sporosarcina luteola]|nr:thiamine pyrophosphokinase [Sporosarcina luteola]
MSRVVVCSGGPEEELYDLNRLPKEETVFIGADRGTLYLLNAGILPVEAIGDFDSVTNVEYERISHFVPFVTKVDTEKDETDTELAIQRALSLDPEHILITGVTGGRLDHFESALHLLYRMQQMYPEKRFTIGSKSNELAILFPGVHRIQREDQLEYVSFFSFGGGKVEGLTLTGFKYEVANASLETGMTRFTSNEAISEVCTISFRKGICLMVRSSDS